MIEKETKEKKIKVEDGQTSQEQNCNTTQEAEAMAAEETTDTKVNSNTEQADEQIDSDVEATQDTNCEDALQKANDEIAALKDKYLRSVAEFENYKKRTLKEKAELIINGSEKSVAAILPVLDDFERALADKSDDPIAIREGVQMIYNKFIKTLESLGVKKMETEDKDFNTDYHEAVAMVPGLGDDKKGKVIDCIQTGYTLNEKVIRHAKVAVGQ
ncbi:MAG: nucleotide exchange factor GrpE [Prevotella sp.]|nr:nucleotide exchange factor GrpE [Prevotella sp.]